MVCHREDEYVVLVDAIDDRVRKSAEHVSVCSVLDRPPAGLLRNEIHGCPDGGREVDAEVTAPCLRSCLASGVKRTRVLPRGTIRSERRFDLRKDLVRRKRLSARVELASPTLDLGLPCGAEVSIRTVGEAIEDLGGKGRTLRRLQPECGFENLPGLSHARRLAAIPSPCHEIRASRQGLATSICPSATVPSSPGRGRWPLMCPVVATGSIRARRPAGNRGGGHQSVVRMARSESSGRCPGAAVRR